MMNKGMHLIEKLVIVPSLSDASPPQHKLDACVDFRPVSIEIRKVFHMQDMSSFDSSMERAQWGDTSYNPLGMVFPILS